MNAFFKLTSVWWPHPPVPWVECNKQTNDLTSKWCPVALQINRHLRTHSHTHTVSSIFLLKASTKLNLSSFFFEPVSHLGGSLNALASELPQLSCHSLGSHYTPNSSTPLNHTCRLLRTSKWKTEHIKIYPVANIIKNCTQKAIGETKKWSDVDAFGASFVGSRPCTGLRNR